MRTLRSMRLGYLSRSAHNQCSLRLIKGEQNLFFKFLTTKSFDRSVPLYGDIYCRETFKIDGDTVVVKENEEEPFIFEDLEETVKVPSGGSVMLREQARTQDPC
jgi:hypothetical protein